LNELQKHRLQEEVVWHAAVMMSNHIHLLFSTQTYNEHSLILDLESELKKELGVKGPLFQRPLPCEPLDNIEHLRAAYKYIYRNPVEVGLARRVEDYTYSSLYLLLNRERPSLQHSFVDPLQLIQNLPVRLRWLNSANAFSQTSFPFFEDQSPGF
jgi:hypothetical protein